MVVLDSSYLVAYYNSSDAHHAAAARATVQLLSGAWGTGLLLDYVFAEVVTVLLSRRGLETAVRVADTLLDAREITFVPCSDLFLDALEVFRGPQGGRLSFADAAIVVAARKLAAGRVLTFDADFRGVDGLLVLPG